MKSRFRSARLVQALTLLELLAVIVIIAILGGLLFPTICLRREPGKSQGKADVVGIAAAVRQYYTEYGKYPVGDLTQSGDRDLTFGERMSNQIVFDILRNIGANGAPNPYNVRGIVFFDGRPVSDPTAPRGGFATQDAGPIKKGAFVDPWGHEYRIVIDTNEDKVIKPAGTFYQDFQNDQAPHTGVCAFSLGKDGLLGDKNFPGYYRQSGSGGKLSDDVISWQ